MLSQSESVFVQFFTQPTDVIADMVFDFGQFSFGFFGDFYYVKSGVDVT